MKLKNGQKLSTALIMATVTGSASAAGFQLQEQNASGIGNAFAGSAAVAENASTIFFNPAGMTELKDREVSLGLTAVRPSFKFRDNGSSVGTLGAAGNGGDAGQLGWIPNAYLSWALNKQWYVGIGVSSPFGLRTEYDTPWKGSAQSNKFEITTYNINPSVAWKINDKVSLGAGVSWQKLKAEYLRQVAVVPLVPPGLPGNTPLALNLNDDAWGWNLGGLFKLSPSTKLGVSYRSKIHYGTTGTIAGTSASAAVNAAVSSNASAGVTLPDTFIASLAHQLNDRWELLGDISWTGWRSIPKIDILRTSSAQAGTVAQTLGTDFRNTWRVALGGNYKMNGAWKLKLGIAYDQTPVKDAGTRLASLPDNNRIWFSAGAQWKASPNSTVDFGLTYLYLKNAGIDNNQSADGRGRLTGTYEDSGLILGAQYSVNF